MLYEVITLNGIFMLRDFLLLLISIFSKLLIVGTINHVIIPASVMPIDAKMARRNNFV